MLGMRRSSVASKLARIQRKRWQSGNEEEGAIRDLAERLSNSEQDELDALLLEQVADHEEMGYWPALHALARRPNPKVLHRFIELAGDDPDPADDYERNLVFAEIDLGGDRGEAFYREFFEAGIQRGPEWIGAGLARLEAIHPDLYFEIGPSFWIERLRAPEERRQILQSVALPGHLSLLAERDEDAPRRLLAAIQDRDPDLAHEMAEAALDQSWGPPQSWTSEKVLSDLRTFTR